MRWLGSALLALGACLPFLVLPFVTVQPGSDLVVHGMLEVSKGTPRTEPRTGFERSTQLAREYLAQAAGETAEPALY